jgi:hypothetical protein
MNDEISQKKVLNILFFFFQTVSTFYILIFIYFCNNYSYIIYLFINIYIIK